MKFSVLDWWFVLLFFLEFVLRVRVSALFWPIVPYHGSGSFGVSAPACNLTPPPPPPHNLVNNKSTKTDIVIPFLILK